MIRTGVYNLDEVIAEGFEAYCVGRHGVIYFWHGTYGVRIDKRKGQSTLLTDPSELPASPWSATSLGAAELASAAADDAPTGDAAATDTAA